MKMVVLILFGIILVIFASFGCIFKESGGKFIAPVILTDKLEAFYLNNTKDKIVIIGENYHYILRQGDVYDPATKNLFFDLLEESKTEPITFYISTNSNSDFISYENRDIIDAYFDVTIDINSASQELIQWAKNLKSGKQNIEVFYKNPTKPHLQTNIFLTGYRYQAKPEINSKLSTLTDPIKIRITDQNMGKTAPTTPLRLDADDNLMLENQKLFLLENLEDKIK